ncbi:MAG: PfaD family polyunsaturated fatty acid/polyketide biosynthesis protein [Deltaproteobacteria bacterium]|nr:PfaD family polyunsaturated fatty acid/polyketide biosynthesis protein [Deltaproteobacteria bacterium]
MGLVVINGEIPEAMLSSDATIPIIGSLAALPAANLGDRSFCDDHGIDYAYYTGAMANGIASVEMVEAAANSGLLGFFGSGGLDLGEIEKAIDALTRKCPDKPFGFNLIHSPNEPKLEADTVQLYLDRNIRLVEAAAFLDVTLPLVRYRVSGISRDDGGLVVTPNHIIAKLSREEVAEKFLSPPPEHFIDELVSIGELSREQAELCSLIPLAQDIVAEADSGGHTDNRPALTLFPTILALRDKKQAVFNFSQPSRIGLGGGISTPWSAAAAYAMGAAFIVTGSVNQACVESGTSDDVRAMLAGTRQADVAMAPAADMFEMGVNVQVLKRGTMFAMRAAKLYELYRNYGAVEDIPAVERTKIEKTMLRCSFEESWADTKSFWQHRDPGEIERAKNNPKHKMALIFRSYLGRAAVWAQRGDVSRKIDYQIFCGPSMGAFNEWVKDSFLAIPENRKVATIALNILYGAAFLRRCNYIENMGISLPENLKKIRPLELGQVLEYLK